MGARAGVTDAALSIDYCGMTDLGRIRKNNEDNYAVWDLMSGEAREQGPGTIARLGPRGALLLVADGMGGEACGEVASATCIEVLPQRLRELLDGLSEVDDSNFVRAIKEAIAFANQTILGMARQDPRYAGMGTTVTAVGLLGSAIFTGQVGDSRAYLLRNGKSFRLTRDQTLLNYLADIGAPLPPDLENDHRKNILTQAVGSADSLDIKVTRAEPRRGDRLLVCSDGFYNMVKDQELEKLLLQQGSLSSICHRLIDEANAHGGSDNITVILAELTGSRLAEPAGEVTVEEIAAEDSSIEP
jgi:PPM family protein phosphatase